MSKELLTKLRATAIGLGSEDPRNYAARGLDVGHCLQAADLIEALLEALDDIRRAAKFASAMCDPEDADPWRMVESRAVTALSLSTPDEGGR